MLSRLKLLENSLGLNLVLRILLPKANGEDNLNFLQTPPLVSNMGGSYLLFQSHRKSDLVLYLFLPHPVKKYRQCHYAIELIARLLTIQCNG